MRILSASGYPGHLLLVSVVALLLAACAGRAPLPDEHYYRLAVPSPEKPYREPPVDGVVVVEGLRAAGVYSERAIVYSDDPNHLSLEHYHYQFWIDTPPRLLQEELIRYLRLGNLASTVTAETGRAVPDYRIRGAVKRFERLKVDKGWQVAVTLELRVDTSIIAPPLLVRDYEQLEPVSGNDMEATVLAFSKATGEIFQQFGRDLARMAKPASAEMPKGPLNESPKETP